MTDPLRSTPPKDDLPGAMSAMLQIWQEAARVASDLAHARRTVFLAYVAEGFTEAQALELVKQL